MSHTINNINEQESHDFRIGITWLLNQNYTIIELELHDYWIRIRITGFRIQIQIVCFQTNMAF